MIVLGVASQLVSLAGCPFVNLLVMDNFNILNNPGCTPPADAGGLPRTPDSPRIKVEPVQVLEPSPAPIDLSEFDPVQTLLDISSAHIDELWALLCCEDPEDGRSKVGLD
ncbi:unnamed protein product [Phytophthora fragariaefolia]|uniref:Unnamed protein product n=1 Tax=Phytophthora fragariaefolia TaxID=1490495 RepID=A0A9W6WYE0_9STRA|nr:unnamed protein product [Phytophthora fragariaefolia]